MNRLAFAIVPPRPCMLLKVGLPIGSQRGILPVNNSLNLASKPFSNRLAK